MTTRFGRIVRNLHHHGFWKTASDLALRVLNRIVFVRIVECLAIESVDPDRTQCSQRFRGLFLTESMLRTFSNNSANELSESFLNHAIAKGDQCFGFLDGDTLASYSWYSTHPTDTDWSGLAIHCSSQYIYMYKGFTNAEYRGNRLYGLGMARALESFQTRGYRGMVSYIEWNNYDSLKGSHRVGFKSFGRIYVLRLFKRYFLHCTAGCDRYAFRVLQVRPSAVCITPAHCKLPNQ